MSRDPNKYNKCFCCECGTNTDLFEHEETQELICRDCLFTPDEDQEEEEE